MQSSTSYCKPLWLDTDIVNYKQQAHFLLGNFCIAVDLTVWYKTTKQIQLDTNGSIYNAKQESVSPKQLGKHFQHGNNMYW